MPALPRILSDRYEIGESLGHGGMGTVYRGRDRVLDRPVAVKLLPAEMASDEAAADRLRREARSAARLNDPRIVSVFDAGVADGTPYLIMEHVEGHTLAEELRSAGRLLPHRAATIAAGIAGALAAAHDAGVIHRDVKPSNVMLTNGDEVKVTDFGIARAMEDTITGPSRVMGSAPYLAPEQARGEAPDPRSDVYGLGVVLYEMLTGHPPFEADSPVAVAFKHVEESPAPPSSHQPDVPPDLDGVVLRALAKDPVDRFDSAEAFLAALRPFSAGQDVASTDPIPAPGGPPRHPSRRRWAVLAAIAVAVVVATVMALTLLGVSRSPAVISGENPRPSVSPPSVSAIETATGSSPGTDEGASRDKGGGGPGDQGGSGASEPTPTPRPTDVSPSPQGSPSPPAASSPPPPSPSPSPNATP